MQVNVKRLVLFFAFFLGVSGWLFRHNPGLLQECTRLRTLDQPIFLP